MRMLSGPGPQRAERRRTEEQTMNDVSKPADTAAYDYVVIGGGSAGCLVAAELSADPSMQVLLLEVGDRAEANPETLSSNGYKYAFINENLMGDRFSIPQADCAQQRMFMGTGMGIGGSGAVNGMVYTRGAREDYQHWPKGWQWEDVLPDFEAIEKVLRPRRRPATSWTEACIGAARETGFRINEDLNDGDLSGVLGYEWMNYEGEHRRNSYVGFLRPALSRPNLTVRTHARAHRLHFDSDRVIRAVEYEHAGQQHTVKVRREAILCAGALETPKLLMLSGVGPRAELERHGIPVVHDSPNLGENLHDHPNVVVFHRGKQDVDCEWPQLYGFGRMNPDLPMPASQSDTCFVFFPARSSMREGATRLSATKLPQWLYKLKPVRKLVRALTYFLFGLPFAQRLLRKTWGLVVILGKPLSRGRVRLASTNAREQAELDPAYFRDPADLETMARGVEKAFSMVHSASMTQWGNRPLMSFPSKTTPPDRLKQWIRKTAMTSSISLARVAWATMQRRQ
jgi:choline dehydrogenase